MAPFELFAKLATRMRNLRSTLPWIALLALSVSIDLVSSSARVTSVKFQKHLVLTDGRTDGHPDPKIGPQVYLGPIKIVIKNCHPNCHPNCHRKLSSKIVIKILLSKIVKGRKSLRMLFGSVFVGPR